MIAARALVLFFLLILSSGCGITDAIGEASPRSETLSPTKLASIAGTDLQRFGKYGVCDPFAVDRSGTTLLWMWREAQAISRPEIPGNMRLVGYELVHKRGQSCHWRNMQGTQAAAFFDLSALGTSAVTSATLEIDVLSDLGVDPPYLGGSAQQCQVVRIGAALADWDSGWMRSRPALPYRPLLRDNGPYLFTGPSEQTLSLDVTREVADWLRGSRENFGFVVSPDMALMNSAYEQVNSSDERSYQCPAWLLAFRLKIELLEAAGD